MNKKTATTKNSSTNRNFSGWNRKNSRNSKNNKNSKNSIITKNNENNENGINSKNARTASTARTARAAGRVGTPGTGTTANASRTVGWSERARTTGTPGTARTAAAEFWEWFANVAFYSSPSRNIIRSKDNFRCQHLNEGDFRKGHVSGDKDFFFLFRKKNLIVRSNKVEHWKMFISSLKNISQFKDF